jgi:hypothetical protein
LHSGDRNYKLLSETGYLERIRGFVDFLQVSAMPGRQNISQHHLTTLPNYNLLPKRGYLERICGFVDFLQVSAMPGRQNISQQHLTTLPNPQFITSL